MKKIFVSLLLLGVGFCHVNGQMALTGNKFADNWSVGVNAGGTTPLTHHSFFKNMRPVVGMHIDKYLTPTFGLSLEAMGSFNTTESKTAFDASNISLLGLVNLNNLFAGYNGAPRLFEVEAVAGIGWLHYYVNSGMGEDRNGMSSKLGMNFNFNLGESKAWTLAVKPALVYDMNAMGTEPVYFHSNRASWEISAGLTYHFGCSNGRHHFTEVKPYDQAEVNNLNTRINQLRSEVDNNAKALREANQKVTDLELALTACQNQKPKVIKDTIDNSKKLLESVITFRQGRISVDNSQLPNVERIATYLKNHKEAGVVIKGYASPEGSAEVNERIARQRAESVRNILVNKYRISKDRIVAEGQGVGYMFEEPDWNRVSICTINTRPDAAEKE